MVQRFYADIPNNLVDAYNLLSPARRSVSFGSWASGYQTTIFDDLENVQLLDETPTTADVRIYLKSEDTTPNGGTLVQHWQGIWHLVNIGGQWYLNKSDIVRVNRYME